MAIQVLRGRQRQRTLGWLASCQFSHSDGRSQRRPLAASSPCLDWPPSQLRTPPLRGSQTGPPCIDWPPSQLKAPPLCLRRALGAVRAAEVEAHVGCGLMAGWSSRSSLLSVRVRVHPTPAQFLQGTCAHVDDEVGRCHFVEDVCARALVREEVDRGHVGM